jgi:hypothetical protein
MAGSDMTMWKDFFVKMAEGKIRHSNFYVLHDTQVNNSVNLNRDEVSVKLISPTQQAVDQSKATLDELPIRERQVEQDLNKAVSAVNRSNPKITAKRKIDKESKYTSESKKNRKTIWK